VGAPLGGTPEHGGGVVCSGRKSAKDKGEKKCERGLIIRMKNATGRLKSFSLLVSGKTSKGRHRRKGAQEWREKKNGHKFVEGKSQVGWKPLGWGGK